MGDAKGFFDDLRWIEEKLPDAVAPEPGSRKMRLVLYLLATMRDGEDDRVRASIPRLARLAGTSQATIRRALRLAVKRGLLKVKTVVGEGSVYQLCVLTEARERTGMASKHDLERRVAYLERRWGETVVG